MAKPVSWDKLPPEQKKKIGVNLFMSMRGQYIISQSLAKAIKVMKKVKPPHKEISNIEDMEILHETLFPIYQPEVMEMARKLAKKKLKKVVE